MDIRKAGTSMALITLTRLLCGCATTQSVEPSQPRAQSVWQSKPKMQSVDNQYFTAEIVPITHRGSVERSPFGYAGYSGFQLTIKNKTDKNLELNWNKTLYLQNGQTSGGFMFEGIVYRDRNNQKPPDIIFSNASLSKEIFPNNLAGFSRVLGWMNGPMPAGENGVYLTLSIKGRELAEKISLTLSEQSI